MDAEVRGRKATNKMMNANKMCDIKCLTSVLFALKGREGAVEREREGMILKGSFKALILRAR